jgi:hypothetical protein
MATCSNCNVSKEETFGWWGVTTPSDQITLCPRCFRFRALSELLVRVKEVVIDSDIPEESKSLLMNDLEKIKYE